MLHTLRYYWQSIIWLSAILYGSFAPKQHLSAQLFLFPYQDKAIHMIMYAILMLIFLLNSRKAQTLNQQYFSFGFVGCIGISLGIEFLQPILSNRSFEIYDFYANAIGAFIGLSTFVLFVKPSAKVKR